MGLQKIIYYLFLHTFFGIMSHKHDNHYKYIMNNSKIMFDLTRNVIIS